MREPILIGVAIWGSAYELADELAHDLVAIVICWGYPTTRAVPRCSYYRQILVRCFKMGILGAAFCCVNDSYTI